MMKKEDVDNLPDNIYYNINIVNNNPTDQQAIFSQQLTSTLLANPKEYYMAVARFSIDGTDLPLFLFPSVRDFNLPYNPFYVTLSIDSTIYPNQAFPVAVQPPRSYQLIGGTGGVPSNSVTVAGSYYGKNVFNSSLYGICGFWYQTNGSPIPVPTSFTGSITGNVLTVTAISAGSILINMPINTNVAIGTTVLNQLSGVPNGIGTYTVSVSQGVPVGTVMTSLLYSIYNTILYGLLTPGMIMRDVAGNPMILAQTSGSTGGTGFYTVNYPVTTAGVVGFPTLSPIAFSTAYIDYNAKSTATNNPNPIPLNNTVTIATGSMLVFIPPGISWTDNLYNGVYSYNEMLICINNAMALSMTLLKAANVAYNAVPPPFMLFDNQSGIMSMVAQQANFTNINPISGIPVQIYFNDNLYSLFENFYVEYISQNNTNRQDELFYIYNIYDTNSFTYTPLLVPEDYWQMFQETKNCTRWFEPQTINFKTSTMGLKSEYIQGVNNTTDLSNVQTAGAGVPSSSIMTDFIPSFNSSEVIGWRQQLVYNPSFYRLIDLQGVNISSVDVSIYWGDRQGVQYPFFIKSGKSATIKLIFVKKSLYKN